MTFHRIFSRLLVAGLIGTACTLALAQLAPDDPDWKEEAVPVPPAFSLDKLVVFDGGGTSGSNLVFAVDPATIKVGGSDSIIRYVMVATGPGGNRNIMFEALRCTTGEAKTYARYNDGRWNMVADPQWRSVFSGLKYAQRFARAGACDNAAPGGTPEQIIRRLKTPEKSTIH